MTNMVVISHVLQDWKDILYEKAGWKE